jgi:hypothetical protein
VDAEYLRAPATSLKEGKGRWKGQGGARWQKSLSEHVKFYWKHFFPLLISTQSVAFWYTDFYITLYFVNQRKYKTLAMQAHALTRTRYFCSLNVIISHLIVYKEGLGYPSASQSSPPSHVCICNGHPGSEIRCVHCTCAELIIRDGKPMYRQGCAPLPTHSMNAFRPTPDYE